MKRKITEKYIDHSLGFPVILLDVPMKEVREEWVPDLALNEFQQVVLWMLAHQSEPLTGRHVRFVRHWMAKTQTEFAAMHDVSHVAVSKWEAKGDEPTSMAKPTEVLLRLNILTELPEDIWDRLSGPNISQDKPSSLKRLLQEIGNFEFKSERPAEGLTVPAGEFMRTDQAPLR
jgi:DNA-binding transcriptional regulator YiaG